MVDKIKKWEASVTVEDENGDVVTVEADSSGCSVELRISATSDNYRVVLNDRSRRALARVLGGVGGDA
jgi:hypothetical protein